MTAILPVPDSRHRREPSGSDTMQVMVHIQAKVLDPSRARRRVNLWLTLNAGYLLMAENPELVLGEPLQWRFDVVLSVPQHDQPGSVVQRRIGQIRLDAQTGEVVDPTGTVEALQAHAGALAPL